MTMMPLLKPLALAGALCAAACGPKPDEGPAADINEGSQRDPSVYEEPMGEVRPPAIQRDAIPGVEGAGPQEQPNQATTPAD
jgi:hypothetical protein